MTKPDKRLSALTTAGEYRRAGGAASGSPAALMSIKTASKRLLPFCAVTNSAASHTWMGVQSPKNCRPSDTTDASLSTAVTAARLTRQGKVMVEAVPAEEFRVNDDADSLDLSDARFVAHTRRRTASDLLRAGYDPERQRGIQHAEQTYYGRQCGDIEQP